MTSLATALRPLRRGVLASLAAIPLTLLAAPTPPSPAPADLQAGAALATRGNGSGALACQSCHGPTGEGMATFPRLAGLGETYLIEQLKAFAQGQRQDPIMSPIAHALSPREMEQVAAHYAALPRAAAVTVADTADSGRGAWLASRGDWPAGIPACAQCHGTGGQGVGTLFPALVGQNADYLRKQLLAWQQQQRPDGPLGLMGQIARKLDPADIEAVSRHYAALPAAADAASAGADAARATAPADPATAAQAAQTPASAAHQQAAASDPTQDTGESQGPVAFTPPPADSIPPGPFGDMVRRGESIFMDTPRQAAGFVGNDLSCVNCHLDAGRLPNSAPMWSAYLQYPAYRKKTGLVDTFASRLQGCFQYSMNGKAPPADSEVITALQTYAYFMSHGAPVGTKVKGGGYPRLAEPAQSPDRVRGKEVFEQNCALCHGADGAGQRSGDRVVFPPLWGERSYNWGAGMHAIDTAAAFIHANMPLGKGGSLSQQQAWDVAAYMNSHERPQDPRFTGDVATTRQQFHGSRYSLYGQTVDGHLLGSGSH